jgi:hypothetical protein
VKAAGGSAAPGKASIRIRASSSIWTRSHPAGSRRGPRTGDSR